MWFVRWHRIVLSFRPECELCQMVYGICLSYLCFEQWTKWREQCEAQLMSEYHCIVRRLERGGNYPRLIRLRTRDTISQWKLCCVMVNPLKHSLVRYLQIHSFKWCVCSGFSLSVVSSSQSELRHSGCVCVLPNDIYSVWIVVQRMKIIIIIFYDGARFGFASSEKFCNNKNEKIRT